MIPRRRLSLWPNGHRAFLIWPLPAWTWWKRTAARFIYEVSAFGGFRGLLEANRVDAARDYARFVLDHLK